MRQLVALVPVLIIFLSLAGCSQNVIPTPLTYKNVLVVGNSITTLGAQAKPDGWNSPALLAAGPTGWGRAASAPEKDFLHLLTTKLQTLNPSVKVVGSYQADFERSKTNYFAPGWVAANPAWNYDTFQQYITTTFGPQGADLVIIQLGENVTDGNVTNAAITPSFQVAYNTLIDRILAKCPDAKLVLTNSFWYRPSVNEVIRQVATSRNLPLADVSDMLANPVYLGETDPATLLAFPTDQGDIHPGDAGMAEIANRIWNKITDQPVTPPVASTAVACPSLTGQLFTPVAGATVIGFPGAANAGLLTFPLSVSVCAPAGQTVATVEIRGQLPDGGYDSQMGFAVLEPGRPGIYSLSYAEGKQPGLWPSAKLAANTYRFYAVITTNAGSYKTGTSLIKLVAP
jgi:GDSL-like Lipase/Acylhydrolase family